MSYKHPALKSSSNRGNVEKEKWQGKLMKHRWDDENLNLEGCFALLRLWKKAPTRRAVVCKSCTRPESLSAEMKVVACAKRLQRMSHTFQRDAVYLGCWTLAHRLDHSTRKSNLNQYENKRTTAYCRYTLVCRYHVCHGEQD